MLINEIPKLHFNAGKPVHLIYQKAHPKNDVNAEYKTPTAKAKQRFNHGKLIYLNCDSVDAAIYHLLRCDVPMIHALIVVGGEPVAHAQLALRASIFRKEP